MEFSPKEALDDGGRFERARKAASWLAASIFATSFVALLLLSATDYWIPGNALVDLCDRVWRVSGIAALALGAIPYVRRFLLHLATFLRPPVSHRDDR